RGGALETELEIVAIGISRRGGECDWRSYGARRIPNLVEQRRIMVVGNVDRKRLRGLVRSVAYLQRDRVWADVIVRWRAGERGGAIVVVGEGQPCGLGSGNRKCGARIRIAGRNV